MSKEGKKPSPGKLPPHVANRKGAEPVFDVPVKAEPQSSKHLSHSGRPHPPKQKAGGDEFDHASQGPTSTQNRGE